MDQNLLIFIILIVFIAIVFLSVIRQYSGNTQESFMTFDPDIQEPYIDMKFKQYLPVYNIKVDQKKYFANTDWYPTTVD